MTDDNDHIGARMFLAKVSGHKRALKAYDGIAALQEWFGHLPTGLDKIRTEIDKKLFDWVKKQFPNDFKKVHDAF